MPKTDIKKLKAVLNNFEGAPVIVIGDIMLDKFIRGSVSRISPEAPVPVVAVNKEYYVAGGAGNVAVNLAALGAKPLLVSVTGEDIEGGLLKKFLSEKGVDTRFLAEDSSRPTTEKVRVIADNQQVVRFDRESKHPLPSTEGKMCLANFRELAKTAKAVIISDYGKGMLSDANIKEVISVANKRGIPVCVDPKLENFKKYKNITCMTPNTKEAWEGAGLTPQPGEEAVENLGRQILKMLNAKSVLITRGAEGMSLFENGKPVKISTVKATAREVFDVTGAGDTVISVLTLALAAKASLREAAILANFAAGIVVGKLGTATATRQEIMEVLK